MPDIEIRLRPFKESDLPFCRDSFYKGAASASDYMGMDQNILKPGLRSRFDRMLKFAEITIACDYDHDEPLFGWVAVTNLPTHSIVWWTYVKAGYRGFGFARQMIEESATNQPIYYPWRSRAAIPVALSFDAIYHPFLLEDLLTHEPH